MNTLKSLSLFFMALICSSLSEIEISPLSNEHRQGVINLLLSSFFLEEPINAMLKFDIPQEPLTWVDHVVDEALREQCSFVVIDTSTKYRPIIGVIINGISHRQQIAENFPVESEKLKFIFQLIDQVSANYNLFDLYQTDRLFHTDIINVDESQRGHNLSHLLIVTSLNKAQQLGLRGAFVVCTNTFSRRAFERQGFHVINEMLYSDFDRLTDMGIHDRCTLLGKLLPVSNE